MTTPAPDEIRKLQAELVATRRAMKLFQKGYEARGKILVAYRTGGRPSGKALDDAAAVADALGRHPMLGEESQSPAHEAPKPQEDKP